jgi:Plasmid stabilization system protein
MQYKIIWLQEANEDMEELYNYYAEKSINTAIRIYNGILEEANILMQHPNLAAIEQLLNDFAKTYRSLVVSKGRYKLVYTVESSNIYIVRVWNCKQEPEKLLKG